MDSNLFLVTVADSADHEHNIDAKALICNTRTLAPSIIAVTGEEFSYLTASTDGWWWGVICVGTKYCIYNPNHRIIGYVVNIYHFVIPYINDFYIPPYST